MKTLAIFSGGQDSTTCLLKAIKEGDEVTALSFYYGQKNSIELDCAESICEKLDISHVVLDISTLMKFISDTPYLEEDGTLGGKSATCKELPSTWVPNRNLLFITIAHSYALKHGMNKIVTGVNAIDYSGYPDCRPEFIDNLQKTLNLSALGKSIKIDTPLIHLSKAQIWDLSKSIGGLDFVIEHSHTCYNGNHSTKHEWGYGCGECDACKIRKASFEEFLNAEKDSSV